MTIRSSSRVVGRKQCEPLPTRLQIFSSTQCHLPKVKMQRWSCGTRGLGSGPAQIWNLAFCRPPNRARVSQVALRHFPGAKLKANPCRCRHTGPNRDFSMPKNTTCVELVFGIHVESVQGSHALHAALVVTGGCRGVWVWIGRAA